MGAQTSTPRERVAELLLGSLTNMRDEKQRARANLVQTISLAQSELTQKQAALATQQQMLSDLDGDLSELQAQIDTITKRSG